MNLALDVGDKPLRRILWKVSILSVLIAVGRVGSNDRKKEDDPASSHDPSFLLFPRQRPPSIGLYLEE